MTESQVDVLIALGAVFVATICWMIVVITLEIKSMLRETDVPMEEKQ